MRATIRLLMFVMICAVPMMATAQNTMRATSSTGIPGFFIDTTVEFDLADDIQGWSFGLCHDDLQLDIMSAVEGADVNALNGGSGADFLSIDTAPTPGAGVTMAAIISGSSSSVLPAGLGKEMLIASYEIIGTPPGMTPITTDVTFCETLGTPATANLVVVAGLEQVPSFVDATVTIDPPPDFCLNLSCTGGQTSAQLDWMECTPFDYYLVHRDGILIDTLPAGSLTYTDPALAPGSYHYVVIAVVFPNPLGTPVVLISECDADVIPIVINSITPDNGTFLGGTEVTVTGRGFMHPTLPTSVELDGVLQTNVTIVDDNTLTFFTEPATVLGPVDLTIENIIAVTEPNGYTYGFIRGDSNSDITLDVADSVYTLVYLFQSGPPPVCFDAADTNDDGFVNIGDPVYGLTFLFSSGPPPPPPFDPQGDDPTPDTLTCI
ncbi:MAG: IPT/TIG domain-containing protein [Planctomycetota bacterium]